MNNDVSRKGLLSKGLMFGIFAIVILLWQTSMIIVPIVYDKFTGIENPGIFGDMFGATNALFSGLAFGGVIIAILLQMKELRYTQKEVQRTAKAQEESVTALRKQVKVLEETSEFNGITAVATYCIERMKNEEKHSELYNRFNIDSTDYIKMIIEKKSWPELKGHFPENKV